MNLPRVRHGTLLWCACAAVALWTTTLSAASLTIFNTGVDNSGNAWGSGGVPDIHYSLFAQPAPGGLTALSITDTAFPFPSAWIANNAGSRWIGPGTPNQPPFDSNIGPGGNYIYRTTFNVPANAVLSTVSITGKWAVDDNGTDILINGASTSQPPNNSYGVLTPFSINSGFVFGTNTLDFLITNANFGANWTGLRVDNIAGTYQIPEPTAVALACGGSLIGGCAVFRRRRC